MLCDVCGSSGAHVGCCDDVISNVTFYACGGCVTVLGEDETRKLALELGIPLDPPRRSRRVRKLSADISECPKHLRIDMAC